MFGKSKVGNEKFARVPAKEVSQILTVYSMEYQINIYTMREYSRSRIFQMK